MGVTKTLGGDRLGSGKKLKITTPTFERSNHNLSYAWRSDVAPGVVYPIMVQPVLPCDNYEIDLSMLTLTRPTLGPVFGDFNQEIHLFFCPNRLYQGLLHGNLEKTTTNMEKILWPQVRLPNPSAELCIVENPVQPEIVAINPSSLIAYLGQRELPAVTNINGNVSTVSRLATPILMYWDIIKNYLINHQEDNAYVLSGNFLPLFPKAVKYDPQQEVYTVEEKRELNASEARMADRLTVDGNGKKSFYTGPQYYIYERTVNAGSKWSISESNNPLQWIYADRQLEREKNLTINLRQGRKYPLIPEKEYIDLEFDTVWEERQPTNRAANIKAFVTDLSASTTVEISVPWLGTTGFNPESVLYYDYINESIIRIYVNAAGTNPKYFNADKKIEISSLTMKADSLPAYKGSEMVSFPIENLDKARKVILSTWGYNEKVEIVSTNTGSEKNYINFLPYSVQSEIRSNKLKNMYGDLYENRPANNFPLNGLAVKTYNSDLFNNWLSKTTIDELNAKSNLDVSSGLTMDALNLAEKLYNYNNLLAAGNGTYQDYLEIAYGENIERFCESPIYLGGMRSMIGFEEVISTVDNEATAAPLGTLGGRGKLIGKRGGHINTGKIKESGFIMGLMFITPNIDYYQGNRWYMSEWKSLADLHVPELDRIGFRNLPVDWQCGWAAQEVDGLSPQTGKIPAWIEYQTNYSEVFGSFAEKNKDMYMVLTRDYTTSYSLKDGVYKIKIEDNTTYIDPKKFNYMFAYSERNALNFWTQIGAKVTARRKMSARIIPNM